MLKNLELKKEIYVSVIVTILTIIFIDPILKFIWGGMIWFGGFFYQGFLNEIYRSAALGHRNYLDEMIFVILGALLIGLAIVNTIRDIKENQLSTEQTHQSTALQSKDIKENQLSTEQTHQSTVLRSEDIKENQLITEKISKSKKYQGL